VATSSVVPLDVYVHSNNVLSRSILDLLGYYPGALAVSRNVYERLEYGLNALLWFSLGIFTPIGLERLMSRQYSRKIRAQFHLNPPPVATVPTKGSGFFKRALFKIQNIGKDSPLQLPFEVLTPHADLSKYRYQLSQVAKNIGHTTEELMAKLKEPGFKQKVLWGKTRLVFVDLLMFAISGQLTAWGKNWMTESLSRRKGFSGEFTYTSNQYLESKNENYQRNKTKRMLTSMAIGFGTAFTFPLLLHSIVKSPSKTKPIQWLQRKMGAFNYHNTIFMSKWVLLATLLANYEVPLLMSSRDFNEFRELFTKEMSSIFFYIIGDDIINGVASLISSKKHKHQLEVPILKEKSQWWFKVLPMGRSLKDIYYDVGKDTKAYKVARINQWIGLLGAAFCMSVFLPLVNFRITKHKALKEQAQLKVQETLTLLQHGSINRLTLNEFLTAIYNQREKRYV